MSGLGYSGYPYAAGYWNNFATPYSTYRAAPYAAYSAAPFTTYAAAPYTTYAAGHYNTYAAPAAVSSHYGYPAGYAAYSVPAFRAAAPAGFSYGFNSAHLAQPFYSRHFY
ncbi:cuticle protein 16.5-like [Pollicipes pollicipes]|uniref:cuticle protein 16.5-like n=1 Tax=Pollicipes pollicipes TaxID=41117 RepID=UPI00188578F9|nr:cuticle protein 16.5-like [Pollicipes pollicipes]